MMVLHCGADNPPRADMPGPCRGSVLPVPEIGTRSLAVCGVLLTVSRAVLLPSRRRARATDGQDAIAVLRPPDAGECTLVLPIPRVRSDPFGPALRRPLPDRKPAFSVLRIRRHEFAATFLL